MRIGQNRLDSLHANVQTRYDGSPEIFTPEVQKEGFSQEVRHTPQSIEDSDVVI
jgi:hypothetical protein